jgi:hypothetical protein
MAATQIELDAAWHLHWPEAATHKATNTDAEV